MGNVGGDPTEMTGGAATLHASGSRLRDLESPLGQQGSRLAAAAGDGQLGAAVGRFAAAFGAAVGDTGVQTEAAGRLAANAATDLRNATGTR